MAAVWRADPQFQEYIHQLGRSAGVEGSIEHIRQRLDEVERALGSRPNKSERRTPSESEPKS
jgi:hypothetical protein